MVGSFRKYIPNSLINYGKHLPEAVMANFRYGFAARKIRVIGVTGTDGKTTTTNMIFKILKDAGKTVSMISTINAYVAGKSYNTGFHVTSPDPLDVQRFISQAVLAGDEFMVLEVTSHALAQFRVWGIPFEFGLITNITHEHLDYHGSFDNYLKSKARLIKNVKVAVLNRDDPSYKSLRDMTYEKVITFGIHSNADFNPKQFPLKLKIPGEYNVYNALGAAALTWAIGVDKRVIQNSLKSFTGLKGRMEEVTTDQKFKVIVDFAHTPNALKVALETLKQKTKNRLIAVFGCAGARDIGKRPLMGEVVGKLADIIILTDEDPRFEDRDSIIEQIAKGAKKAGAIDGKNLLKEPDRNLAIEMAIKMAKPGDVIGIFGKGHEESMNYQGFEKPWSDQKAAREALKL